MIVSDAGPIVVFARIGRLSLLGDVTGTLLIPDAVHSEIFANQGAMPGASEVAQATLVEPGWVRGLAADPYFAAFEMLFFPDGDDFLQAIDREAAGLKGLGAMRG
jgi:hypothetical protein